MVPGCIHTDLLRQGLIPDPHYRDNEKTAVQWVAERDWVYARTFRIEASVLQNEQVVLRCKGLDTLATVFVNDIQVGKADNFHRVWEFDVKEALHAGENRIRVHFASILPFITRMDEEERPMPVWKQPGGEHRFVSEFGMQSFPEPRTINRVTLPEERSLMSPMMAYRQRSGPGNRMILDYMKQQFQLPEET